MPPLPRQPGRFCVCNNAQPPSSLRKCSIDVHIYAALRTWHNTHRTSTAGGTNLVGSFWHVSVSVSKPPPPPPVLVHVHQKSEKQWSGGLMCLDKPVVARNVRYQKNIALKDMAKAPNPTARFGPHVTLP